LRLIASRIIVSSSSSAGKFTLASQPLGRRETKVPQKIMIESVSKISVWLDLWGGTSGTFNGVDLFGQRWSNCRLNTVLHMLT